MLFMLPCDVLRGDIAGDEGSYGVVWPCPRMVMYCRRFVDCITMSGTFPVVITVVAKPTGGQHKP